MRSTPTKAQSLRRRPLTLSTRQKSRKRSEIRKNNTALVMTADLYHNDGKIVYIPFAQSQNSIHTDAVYLSPVDEAAAAAATVTARTAIPSATELTINSSSVDGSNKILIQDTCDMYDSTSILPYSNKPRETSQKTITEESKQWENLFDPQHSFGSFQHTIPKPVAPYQYFYKGKWPLETKDIIGVSPGKGIVNAANTILFPNAPDPTLPDLDQLEQLINTPLQMAEEEGNSINGSMSSLGHVEILPCTSLSSFPGFKRNGAEKVQLLWKDRLELLNTIQQQGFREEWNGTQSEPHTLSKTARLKRKASQIKREALVHTSTKDKKRNTRCVSNNGSYLIETEPDREHRNYRSSLANMEEGLDVPYHNNKKGDTEKQIKGITKPKNTTRLSFLLFGFGFLVPPLWVIGALYSPSIQKTSSCQKIDHKWRKYSRRALFVFLVLLAAIFVLLLAFKPQVVGFRNSNESRYEEERVVFDEDDGNRTADQQ